MKFKKVILLAITILIIFIFLSTNFVQAATTYKQSVKTGIDAFPASYQVKLRALANKYPNWVFQAYNTGISWNDLISKERDESVHRNRVPYNSPASWKNSCDFTENGWSCASDDIVKYYIDPRNFLTETQIFQFVETSYNPDIQTLAAIKKSVSGTFLDKTITCKNFNNKNVTMSYSEIIIEAAKQSNISAFYIKSKIMQEVSSRSGTKWGSDSVTGTYKGYKGYYNFFNYGAYDEGDPIANGLQFAKQHGWDSPYKAIIDGAKLIGSKYIEQGQNTAYFNKWDVVGTKILKNGQTQTVSSAEMFSHQYMTNIMDPNSQAASTYNLYKNSLNSKITFIIPVYNNMPSSVPMPELPFKDVRTTDWFYDVVKYTYKNGIIMGYDEARFAPQDTLTRGQLITMLWRMENEPDASKLKTKFKDIKTGVYYTDAVKWAESEELVKGYGGTSKFGPDDPIIRQDLAIILNRYAKYKKKNTSATAKLTGFKDYKTVSDYAEESVKWAVQNKIINGNTLPNGTKTIAPLANTTRAEVAAMLTNYCNKFNK